MKVILNTKMKILFLVMFYLQIYSAKNIKIQTLTDNKEMYTERMLSKFEDISNSLEQVRSKFEIDIRNHIPIKERELGKSTIDVPDDNNKITDVKTVIKSENQVDLENIGDIRDSDDDLTTKPEDKKAFANAIGKFKNPLKPSLENMKSLNLDSIRKILKFKDFLKNLNMNVTEHLCFVARSHMDILPGFDPINKSILQLFKSNVGKIPKSFRTIGLNLFHNMQFIKNNYTRVEEDDNLVKQLRDDKQTYYIDYFMKDKNRFIISKDNVKNTEKKFKKLKNEYTEHTQKYNKIKDKNKEKTDELNNYLKIKMSDESVEKPEENKEWTKDYSKLAVQREEMNIEISKIKKVKNYLSVLLLNADLAKKYKIFPYIVLLKLQTGIVEIYNNHIDHLQLMMKYLVSHPKSDKEGFLIKKANSVKVSKLKLDMERSLIEKKKSVDRTIEDILTVYKNKFSELEKQIKKIKEIGKYKDKLKELKNIRDSMARFENIELDFLSKLSDLEGYMTKNNILENKSIDYIITDQEIDLMEKEYTVFMEVLIELGENIELEDSRESKEILNALHIFNTNKSVTSKKKTFLPNHGLNMESMIEKVDNEAKSVDMTQAKNFDSLKNYGESKTLFQGTLEVTTKFLPYYKKRFEFLRAKLTLAKNIRFLEGKVDSKLGEMFALINRTTNLKKCFSFTNLSYYLFNMVKTNIIINEKLFFKSYTDKMAENNPNDLQRFILLNYSLYADDDYLISISEEMNSKGTSKEMLTSTSINFISNFSLVMNSYKEVTDYSKDLEYDNEGFVEKFMSRMKNTIIEVMTFVFMYIYKEKIKNDVEAAITIPIAIVVKSIMGGIPLLGKIPGLEKIVTFAIAKLLILIMDVILEYFEEVVSDKMDELTEMFDDIALEISSDRIKNFNWEKSILQSENLGSEMFSAKRSEVTIEDIFYNASIDPKSLFNKIGRIDVWTLTNSELLQFTEKMEEINLHSEFGQERKLVEVHLQNFLVHDVQSNGDQVKSGKEQMLRKVFMFL